MSRMYETQCGHCGKKIQKRAVDKDRYKNRFCSLKCQYDFRTTRVTLQCDQCGKDVIKRLSQIKKTKHNFCNRSCATTHRNKRRTGKNHPSYIDGTANYRARAIKHYGAYCHNSDCELEKLGLQVSESMLDVHHIDGNRGNGELSNLIVLCAWCHAKHTRLKEYEFS